MDCKLLDCEEPATVRVVTPFGTGNLCAEHGEIASGWAHSDGTSEAEQVVLDGLVDAFRYGPLEDPSLELEERGEGFPRLQRRGPLTDVFDVGPLPDGDRIAGRGRLAMVRCPHGKWWVEGKFGCEECVPAALGRALEENLK